MTYALSVATLWRRELTRFLRQRSRVLGALGTPLLFWLVLGSGLGVSFRPPDAPPGMNYLEYFFPGTILLIILFTTIFSSISVIEDRKEGFLLSVLVAPVSRSAIVLGKILGTSSLAFMQALILVALAPWLGISFTLEELLILLAALFLISICLAGLGFATAWQTESVEGYHSIMNLLLFPMWLLSGAVFPLSGAFEWIRWIMLINPLTYPLSLLRHLLTSESDHMVLPSVTVSLLLTFFFGATVFVLSLLSIRYGKLKGLK